MAEEPTLKRSMNLLTLTFYGLGTIIGAVIYVLIGEVAGVAGDKMPWSFLLAGLIAVFTALSYAELASRFPVSAGVSVYIRSAWNLDWLSALAGWLIVLTGILSAAAISNGFAGYITVFIDVESQWAILALCLLLCAIAVYGINLSANTVFVITLIEVAGLGYVVWVAMGIDSEAVIAIRASALEQTENGAILVGAFLAFYAFIGFEDMVNVIEEVKNPVRNFPIAINE